MYLELALNKKKTGQVEVLKCCTHIFEVILLWYDLNSYYNEAFHLRISLTYFLSGPEIGSLAVKYLFLSCSLSQSVAQWKRKNGLYSPEVFALYG